METKPHTQIEFDKYVSDCEGLALSLLNRLNEVNVNVAITSLLLCITSIMDSHKDSNAIEQVELQLTDILRSIIENRVNSENSKIKLN